MEILRFLEGIRTPLADSFFSLITVLGEETLFIAIGIILFWCFDKREGYYILSVGLLGTVVNQFLKLTFRIPRPWVRDESFTIVEAAREEATGYSFPSGHTQLSVGTFSSLSIWNKNKILRAVCIVLCVLVPFSRLYLGVHTPLDVGVSLVIALMLSFAVYPLVRHAYERPCRARILFAVMTVVSVAYLLFICFFEFPSDIDLHNLESGAKKAYTMLGCIIGLWLTYEIDSRFIRFTTKAGLLIQLLKFSLGFAFILAIKILMKQPLYGILPNNHYLADGIRYFMMTAFAGCVWPITFKYFNKLFSKEK